MSIGLNHAEIIGNLGADPEMQFTPNGHPTTTFNVAVSRQYKADGADKPKDETTWFRVVTWNALAETCNQRLGKGMRVYAAGRIKFAKWTDQAGQNHARLELVAERVLFLDRKLKDNGDEQAAVGQPIEADPDANSQAIEELSA